MAQLLVLCDFSASVGGSPVSFEAGTVIDDVHLPRPIADYRSAGLADVPYDAAMAPVVAAYRAQRAGSSRPSAADDLVALLLRSTAGAQVVSTASGASVQTRLDTPQPPAPGTAFALVPFVGALLGEASGVAEGYLGFDPAAVAAGPLLIPVARACVASALVVHVSANPLLTDLVVTLVVDGVATAVSVTVPTTETGSFVVAATEELAAGATVDVHVTNEDGGADTAVLSAAVEISNA